MQRECEICGKMFEVPEEYPRKKVCSPECYEKKYLPTKKERKPKQKTASNVSPKSRVQTMTINEVLSWAEQHYRRTGERLWYGRAVARLENAGRLTLESRTKA